MDQLKWGEKLEKNGKNGTKNEKIIAFFFGKKKEMIFYVEREKRDRNLNFIEKIIFDTFLR